MLGKIPKKYRFGHGHGLRALSGSVFQRCLVVSHKVTYRDVWGQLKTNFQKKSCCKISDFSNFLAPFNEVGILLLVVHQTFSLNKRLFTV